MCDNYTTLGAIPSLFLRNKMISINVLENVNKFKASAKPHGPTTGLSS